MLEKFFIVFIIYLAGIVVSLFLSLFLEDSDWKYSEFKYVFLYPFIPILLIKDIIINFNNYLNKNKLKQMNFKILGRAMSFMLLPTLGVLLMLLVGFFDPIAMWTWIKSDSFWAVTTRIIIFVLEAGLVMHLYFDYLEKENKDKAEKLKNDILSGKADASSFGGRLEEVYYSRDLYQLWSDGKTDNSFKFYSIKTPDQNVIIVQRIPKN